MRYEADIMRTVAEYAAAGGRLLSWGLTFLATVDRRFPSAVTFLLVSVRGSA